MIFQRKFEHSQKLVDTALEEFIAYGYDQASINRILENAGMSKGQFYYYFKSKEGLYLALIEHLISKKKAFLASTMKAPYGNQDVFSLLKEQMKYSMIFAREYPVISRFSESFLKEKGTPIYQKAISIHNFENNDAIMYMVRQAIEHGDFRNDLSPEFIQKLMAYLFTHIAELAGIETENQFETGVDDVIDFIQYGLAGKPRGTKPG